jgi:hypothetical protein
MPDWHLSNVGGEHTRSDQEHGGQQCPLFAALAGASDVDADAEGDVAASDAAQSESRSPACRATAMSAWSRRPSHRARSGAERKRMSTATRKPQQLMSVQHEVLAFVRHRSLDGQRDGWVKVAATHAAAARRGLVTKGWLEERETPLGNDGATTWWVRPLLEDLQ